MYFFTYVLTGKAIFLKNETRFHNLENRLEIKDDWN